MSCSECPYKGSKIIKTVGSSSASIVFVGEAPGREEVQAGMPFVGPSGRLLKDTLKKVGITNSIAVANSVRCWVDNTDKKKVSEGMKNCREYLENTLRTIKPKLIVTLGDVALRQVLKMQKILSNRGRFFRSEEFDCDVFVSVHPAYILRGMQKGFPNISYETMTTKEKTFYNDFKRIAEYREKGQVPQGINTKGYKEIKAKDISNYKDVVAIDYETNTLDLNSKKAKVLCISFSNKEGEAGVYFFKDNKPPKELKKFLADESILKVVASRPFEEKVSSKILGVDIKGKIVDVLTMAHVLDENNHEYNLQSVANVYSKLHNIKSLAQGKRDNLEELDKKDLIAYNGCDSDATLQSFKTMRGHADKDLMRYYTKFIMPVQDAFAKISLHGCKVDKRRLKANEEKAYTLIGEAVSKCIKRIPKSIQLKYADDLNLNRTGLIIDYLFTHEDGLKLKPKMVTGKTGAPSTAEDHLKMFSNPFLKDFRDYKQVSKILNTYLSNLWTFIRDDGRVYPDALLTRQVTGRMSTINPPMITYPQRGQYANLIRECIVADRGWSIGARDLDQSEIKIMGWAARDHSILDAVKRDIDLHTKTASIVTGKPLSQVSSEDRQKAKVFNFGFLFGMFPKGFVNYAKSDYGMTFTEAEATEIRRKFFAEYNKLPLYYEKIKEETRRMGYARSALGRRRRLVDITHTDFMKRSEAERQAINFGIQSLSSDLGLLGLTLFQQEIEGNTKLREHTRILWFIHDNVMFQARNNTFDLAMKLLKECMEERTKEYIKTNFGVDIDYKITSSGKRGPSWAELKKCD